ncbi:uncharacterized protein LOC130942227 isoform X2 [Arachis stenosperma]|uniref:uncharacterized protein LOC130942227 isoform X2 n=1 Tax=Arachis stenosperma TaxID=217475 RepID=UPI0025ACC122|nr:uncharacterized protein LOC130942227 isoform X2 [Arachis stenosperma]
MNMAISLSTHPMMMSFNSLLQAKYQDSSWCSNGVSLPKATQYTPFLAVPVSRMFSKEKRFGHCLSVADSDQLEAGISNKDPPAENSELQANVNAELESRTSDASEVSTDQNQGSAAFSNPQSNPKRLPLTARERLRAARVLNRYTESKTSKKSDMGSRVLDALKESDRGKKRSRLPEAPTDMLDDSKRGLPKAGLTFSFPGGFDLFIVAFSFVFISTVMFATTYFVWKVGAIHFNEY